MEGKCGSAFHFRHYGFEGFYSMGGGNFIIKHVSDLNTEINNFKLKN